MFRVERRALSWLLPIDETERQLFSVRTSIGTRGGVSVRRATPFDNTNVNNVFTLILNTGAERMFISRVITSMTRKTGESDIGVGRLDMLCN